MTKIDDLTRFQEIALSVRGMRHQLLASNIANADTPGYKARDVNFNEAFNAALNNKTSQTFKKTHASHSDPLSQLEASGDLVKFRTNGQGNIDGNTVDMDVERNQFAENALKYEASLTILNMNIKKMLSVIQG